MKRRDVKSLIARQFIDIFAQQQALHLWKSESRSYKKQYNRTMSNVPDINITVFAAQNFAKKVIRTKNGAST